uniref:Uncharacterized protein n=1 Tax=Nomascus leucogenys TaxID=61853 RepID=A0A2I3GMR8_NOMLE
MPSIKGPSLREPVSLCFHIRQGRRKGKFVKYTLSLKTSTTSSTDYIFLVKVRHMAAPYFRGVGEPINIG